MRDLLNRRSAALFASVLALAVIALPAIAQAKVLEYQLQYMPTGSGGVSQMIVNVILTPDTELPATVRVPLPEGARVVWTGEIVGDDPTQDPYREATVTAVSGGQIVEFVMSEARVAQLEADYSAPTLSGTKVSATLPWVNTGEEAPLLASVRIEPGADGVKISPDPVGEPLTNEDGEKLYSLDSVTLATGETFEIAVAYSRGGASDSGSTTVALAVAGGLLLVAVVALFLVMSRDRRRRESPSSGRPRVAVKSAAASEDDDELTF